MMFLLAATRGCGDEVQCRQSLLHLHQVAPLCLSYRHREQARSHRGVCTPSMWERACSR
ncbi:hypothetical protein AK973_0737 [Pseudomonas brassicacearum]|nr:hypothetical protein AK973_0737 [Pseudomonas brassicacearum]